MGATGTARTMEALGTVSGRRAPGPRGAAARSQARGGGTSTSASRAPVEPQAAYLGLDFGTSGARAMVIDDRDGVLHSEKVDYGDAEEAAGSASVWRDALFSLLGGIPSEVTSNLRAICLDGTSSTSLLVDRETWSIESRPLLYNFAARPDVVARVTTVAPEGSITRSPTSTLCKLFTWLYEDSVELTDRLLLVHQADWLASLLLERPSGRGVSDYNNALKLGYDPEIGGYPDWMLSQAWQSALPAQVLAPSTPIGPVSRDVSSRYGIPSDCQVAAGTTDSIAAFLAAGASSPGEAVTSLGSTLAIKVLSEARVDKVESGVYSHKLWGDLWLAGGASNTGGAVLRKFFTDEEVRELTQRIDPNAPTGLGYYPLVKPGERFPVADDELKPKLEPRPAGETPHPTLPRCVQRSLFVC